MVTALVYLNKVEAGGATQFPKLGITVPAQPGRMVLFHNTTEDISGPHPLSLHAGMPVESGEKWAFNLWFRLHDIRESYDASKPLPRISLNEDAPAASRVIAEPVVTEMPPIAPLSVANEPAKQRLTVVANRANVLWQRAVKTLKAVIINLPGFTPVTGTATATSRNRTRRRTGLVPAFARQDDTA